MEAQIAKYRAEAADYRNRANLARDNGCAHDAASYDSIAESRESLADAMEADLNYATINEMRDEQGLEPLPEVEAPADEVHYILRNAVTGKRIGRTNWMRSGMAERQAVLYADNYQATLSGGHIAIIEVVNGHQALFCIVSPFGSITRYA